MAERIVSPDTERKDRVPPGQTLTEKWPVLHYGGVPSIDTGSWIFTISGLVEEEKTLTYDEFTSLPMTEVFSDIHCVTTWSRLNNTWQGVSTETIGKLVKLKPEARYVIVQCYGRFSTNLTLGDFFQPDVLFTLMHDGEPLSQEHGAPVRLIVPRLYMWKSAKWVSGIRFVSLDEPGFWESNGYHNHGDPWKEERYAGR